MHTICFDLDGTLTDPKIGITGSIQHALKTLGHPCPEADDLTWCIGPPLLASLKTLTGDRQEGERALALYRERFSETGLFENAVYPGIEQTLTTLAEAGHQMFVATSKPTVFATRIIDHFGLSGYFERVFGSELDGTRTDKSDLLAYVISETGINGAQTSMIGDRRHDMIGARNNKLTAIGVLYGYGSRDELIDAGAHHICTGPEGLIAAVRSK